MIVALLPRLYYTGADHVVKLFVLDIRERITYNEGMNKAPITAGTAIGTTIRTAEAVQTRNLSIGLLAAHLKEIRSDLPQLPN